MTLTVAQTATAVGPNAPASFQAYGGAEPYLYEIVAGGAGGTVDATTGVYAAPPVVSSDLARAYDTIRVTDYAAVVVTTRILVGTPLLLVCDILQRELQLADDHIYLWDQKLFQPKDSTLYVAVSVPTCKPFGNTRTTKANGTDVLQYVSMLAVVDIDIISRGPAARDRKEEVLLALNSVYSENQQNANSFYIGRLPISGGFRDLSLVDGAAIPYRYKISFNMQYFVTNAKAVPYFDDFALTETIDP